MPRARLNGGWAAIAAGTATILGAVYLHGVRVYHAPASVGALPPAARSQDAPESAAADVGADGTAGPPVLLTLPSLHVQAPVQAVGTDARGRLAVPDDPRTLGWWNAGRLPGAVTGAVVVDGHVDSAHRGLGALLELSHIGLGAPVVVRTASGRVFRYRVTARRLVPRNALPSQAFSRTGPPRLVLITCGGPFDRRTHHYTGNVVVFAAPDGR